MRHRWYRMNDHLERLHVWEPYFIDRESAISLRVYREHPYELLGSGMHPKGGAALLGTFRTLKEALAAVPAPDYSAGPPRMAEAQGLGEGAP